MITEDYVSFETAKLLKEKGFDNPCRAFWKDLNGKLHLFNCDRFELCNNSRFREETNVAAPTLQVAMKWLREKHDLHCRSGYDLDLGWCCQIISLKETVSYDWGEIKHYHPDNDNGFNSPKEALEAAIKYCLENLI